MMFDVGSVPLAPLVTLFVDKSVTETFTGESMIDVIVYGGFSLVDCIGEPFDFDPE